MDLSKLRDVDRRGSWRRFARSALANIWRFWLTADIARWGRLRNRQANAAIGRRMPGAVGNGPVASNLSRRRWRRRYWTSGLTCRRLDESASRRRSRRASWKRRSTGLRCYRHWLSRCPSHRNGPRLRSLGTSAVLMPRSIGKERLMSALAASYHSRQTRAEHDHRPQMPFHGATSVPI